MTLVVKKLPSSVGDAGDVGSIAGLGRSPGGGNDTNSSKVRETLE